MILNGLAIESDLVTPGSANFRLQSWPPPVDFPVVIDALGRVVARFGDAVWDLGPWAGSALTINFGDGATRGRKVNAGNANLFRCVAAQWLWGPNAVRTPRTLKYRHELLKPLFVLCTEIGISASDLYRFPKVIERIAAAVAPSGTQTLLTILHDMWMSRETLGFVVLDDAGLRQLSTLLPKRNSTQTAYIPPRIWTYQVLRLRECLDEYIAHQKAIEECYWFCVKAYEHNVSAHQKASSSPIPAKLLPFGPANFLVQNRGNRVFYGPFEHTAKRFGIDRLLHRWVNFSGNNGIKAFTSYLSLISQAGLAFILNFSLMRIEEGCSLRAGCYEVERDEMGEDIHLLSGVSTKTVETSDARWIVSPSVKIAIDAMSSVAKLRGKVSEKSLPKKKSKKDSSSPYLQSWALEPWAAGKIGASDRKSIRGYLEILKTWPKLFDEDQLRIRESDMAIANRLTFGLDSGRFSVGKIWPLGWHQLRRTGAVNMLSTGYVSDASLQYQLKHATRAMTRYYGQSYYHLKGSLDDDTRGFYLREMYEAVIRDFKALHSDRFVSPHGDKRKAQIIRPISEKDHQGLLRDSMSGQITYKETFLGACAKQGAPCPLGGITNISGCIGYGEVKACDDSLIDRSKRPIIASLVKSIQKRLVVAELGSRLRESLEAQIESAKRALNVIDTV